MLELQGRAALSDFRIAKLLSQLQAFEPRAQTLGSRFVHFIDLSAPLTTGERELLATLLTYGPSAQPQAASAGPAPQVLLVVPRAGTISPWSSKATDIAQVCGLGAVRRIERGIRYELGVAQALDLAAMTRVAAPL